MKSFGLFVKSNVRCRGETSPFNSGVSARIALPKPMMPCSNFLLLATIFRKNVGEGGGV